MHGTEAYKERRLIWRLDRPTYKGNLDGERGLTQRHTRRQETNREQTYMERDLREEEIYMKMGNKQRGDSYGKGTYVKTYMERGKTRRHIRRENIRHM